MFGVLKKVSEVIWSDGRHHVEVLLGLAVRIVSVLGASFLWWGNAWTVSYVCEIVAVHFELA